ncbi:MAG: hypothetical protein LEGION0398_MBIBDBAK_00414 [Legionellaceae bacterium]
MAILQRADGIRFIVRSYRELITQNKVSLLRKELLLQSQVQGQYARFYRQKEGKIEAVFSHDMGYLLGESIWHYFNTPDNLIYCETIPNETDVIVVIIRNGSVYLEAKLTLEELREELHSLLSVKTTYSIFLVGDVPIVITENALVSEEEQAQKFLIPSEYILQFEQLNESVFEQLPASSAYFLFPIEKAIDELKLDRFAKNTVTASIILILLIACSYWLFSPSTQKENNTPVLSPYEQYAAALNNPDPQKQLHELAKHIVLLQTMPGWLPVNIKSSSMGSKVQVHTLGSPTALLLAWAKKNKANVDFNTEGAFLILPSRTENRNNIPQFIPLNMSLSLIIDKMMQIIPGKSVSITSTSTQVSYKTAGITITFNAGSFILLTLIGNALKDLPVIVNSSTITIQNGLLSGNIQLTVLGN